MEKVGMIEAPKEEYINLVCLESKVQSIMAYVNRTRHSVDREMNGGILGFTVNEVKDETD